MSKLSNEINEFYDFQVNLSRNSFEYDAKKRKLYHFLSFISHMKE